MVDPDAVRRGYDELADAYAAERTREGPGVDVLAAFLDSLAKPSRVLDAGCGNGQPALPLLRDVAPTVGLDFSGEQLRRAAIDAPAADFVQGDLRSLPFADATFDAAVALWSLIHVPMVDHESTIAEFARVLRPGGRLLLTEGTHRWRGENPDWLDSGVPMAWHIAGSEATRGHLQNAGFSILREWTVPETLCDDDGDEGDADGEDSWRLFEAELDR